METLVFQAEGSGGLNDGWRHVRDFHFLCGSPIATAPTALTEDSTVKWSKWFEEELAEFRAAKCVEDQADAAMDLIYFALGSFVEMGIPPQKVFELVHQANLRKAWPNGEIRFDNEGKVVKPDQWLSPQTAVRNYILSLKNNEATVPADRLV